jgi:hypothetical protein
MPGGQSLHRWFAASGDLLNQDLIKFSQQWQQAQTLRRRPPVAAEQTR